jgi:hypothetical protein
MSRQQDLIDEWYDIQAYRTLAGQAFDFGTGLITDDSTESEDAYWEERQWTIENALLKYEPYYDTDILYWYKKVFPYSRENYIFKQRRRKYKTTYIDRVKFKRLIKKNAYFYIYYEKNNRYKRFYLSDYRKFAKYCTNKKIRHNNDFPLKGGGYKRSFDYWNIVF